MELEPVQRLTKDLRAAAKTLSVDEARFLVDRYYQIQDQRIGSRNQERAASTVEQEPHDLLSYLGDQMETLETQIKNSLDKWTMAQPIGERMRAVVGVGPVIAAGIIANVDITKANHVSALWCYAGQAPGQKRTRGQLSNWNPALKRLMWLLGESFVKVSGNENAKYGKIYLRSKAKYQAMNEAGEYAGQAATILAEKKWGADTKARARLEAGKLPDAQIHARAKRKAVKAFLSDLWFEWRIIEGLPIRDIYAIEHMHHPVDGDGKVWN